MSGCSALSALRSSAHPVTYPAVRGLMMSSAGMTKRLDRLEKLGLVKRNPDIDDRRGVTIHLRSVVVVCWLGPFAETRRRGDAACRP